MTSYDLDRPGEGQNIDVQKKPSMDLTWARTVFGPYIIAYIKDPELIGIFPALISE